MIGEVAAEEAARCASASLEPDRRIANDDHRVLVLETAVRQLRSEAPRNRPVAICEPMKLQRVRGEGRAFAQ